MLCAANAAFSQDVATAEQQFWNKSYADAEATSRKVLESDSSNADARYVLGMTLIEEGKTGEADQQINAARDAGLALDKQKVMEGRAAIAKKQLPDAQKLLTEAITENPKNQAAYFYRGLAYASAGDYNKAVADLEKATELEPTNFLAHYYAGVFCNRIKRPDKMVAHFERLVKLAPNSEEAQKAQALLRSVR